MIDGAAQPMPAAVAAGRDPPDGAVTFTMVRGVMDVGHARRRRCRFFIIRLLFVDSRKIGFAVLVNLDRGEKFRVVVLTGEAEMGPIVAAQDLAVITAASGLHRLHHSAGTVIVK